MSTLFIAIKLILAMTLLTGVIYPLLIALFATMTFPDLAGGSLVIHKDKIIGSELISQAFTKEHYFWPRPSYKNYDPLSTQRGSLHQTSLKLRDKVNERLKRFDTDPKWVPVELVYSSGSGLDPHISFDAAYFQIERIAKARQIKEHARLKYFIDYIGESRNDYVNVLKLNQALDEHFPLNEQLPTANL